MVRFTFAANAALILFASTVFTAAATYDITIHPGGEMTSVGFSAYDVTDPAAEGLAHQVIHSKAIAPDAMMAFIASDSTSFSEIFADQFGATLSYNFDGDPNGFDTF